MRCRFIGVLLVLPACGGPADGSRSVQVYVAASAGDAVTSALAGCADPHAQDAVVVTASSATLARQIEHGAAADLFVSASPEWVDHLQERALIVPSSRTVLLGNALVVVASADEPSLLASLSGEALTARLGGGRLAVGDPDHVPAGRYAREAFESLGMWGDVQPRWRLRRCAGGVDAGGAWRSAARRGVRHRCPGVGAGGCGGRGAA